MGCDGNSGGGKIVVFGCVLCNSSFSAVVKMSFFPLSFSSIFRIGSKFVIFIATSCGFSLLGVRGAIFFYGVGVRVRVKTMK